MGSPRIVLGGVLRDGYSTLTSRRDPCRANSEIASSARRTGGAEPALTMIRRMAAAGRTVDGALGIPAPALRPYVVRYVGYRFLGFPPGVHLGLPSRYLTVVLALGPPTRLDVLPDERQPPASFRALASGLAGRRVVIGHDGDQYGVQFDVTTLGARALFGVPAGELFDQVVNLALVLGDDADELVERMTTAPGWRDRFAVLDAVL